MLHDVGLVLSARLVNIMFINQHIVTSLHTCLVLLYRCWVIVAMRATIMVGGTSIHFAIRIMMVCVLCIMGEIMCARMVVANTRGVAVHCANRQ